MTTEQRKAQARAQSIASNKAVEAHQQKMAKIENKIFAFIVAFPIVSYIYVLAQ